ncbi:MAG: hypothetical protein U5N85_11245 [Arcicella sp.]|nr:hypothetical protein [Arcicella sp.]
MKKYMIAAMIVISSISSAIAQYDNRDYAYNDDRFYYDNEFDWHWDIRVRISDGIQRGLITRRESDLLYRRLEDLERKEYAYQSDGIFTSWEQQEIWDDVVYLNRRLGLELSDYDRNFYGFDVYGYDRRGYSRWYYQGGYDFFRFDKRGFGSIRLGYVPRPNYNGWYRNQNNRVAQRYCIERRDYTSRGNSPRGNDRDRRGIYNNQYPNNSNRGGNDRNRGNYDGNRNSQNESSRRDTPNNIPYGGVERNRGNVEPNRIETPANIPQGSRSDRPNFESNNRLDNNGKSGNDWNGNRGGVNRERSTGRRDNK